MRGRCVKVGFAAAEAAPLTRRPSDAAMVEGSEGGKNDGRIVRMGRAFRQTSLKGSRPMTSAYLIHKVFEGAADRQQMFRLFNRHGQRPNRWADDAAALHRGEWFEIEAPLYDDMCDLLPPLWMRGGMFAMSEFLSGSVTSVFFTIQIDGRARCFHGYCDLSDSGSPDRMRAAIIARESRPVRAMTREERLEHIWSITHEDYRGYAGPSLPAQVRGKRTVLCYGGGCGTILKLLDELTDAEICAKLPVHLRHLPEAIAA